jgi:hypothetical protein
MGRLHGRINLANSSPMVDKATQAGVPLRCHVVSFHRHNGEAMWWAIHQVLQEYEIRVRSVELATWYIEMLPSGMAASLPRVGPALEAAFAVPGGMVVPPGEANSTRAGLIHGPPDQDQDMDGPPASSENGATESSLASATTLVGPPIAEPMQVEVEVPPRSLGVPPLSSEPESAQEGESVKDV